MQRTITIKQIALKNIFDIQTELFHVLGYSMSYLEFFGVLSGLAATWLSARAHIISWPVGIVNVVLSFWLYFQVHLYPDMLLQVFFFITNILGWWRWAHPRAFEADPKKQLKVSFMKPAQLTRTILVAGAGTFLLGNFAGRLHEWFPSIFSAPSSFPFADSFIMVMSILATFYMIQKKIECWIIWMLVDVTATVLYYVKGIRFYSLEYLVFTGIVLFGFLHWIKEYRSYSSQPV
ncbi:nicotinamide riboside transporter PnuC [Niabella sp.]|uniref:nicotinamide riboside transporter PnuC n=1 Tax=Niabella sp. TaxID=1962976 RepID=UPI00261EDA87|nr:nicotinamide riboside transporter PnuC [Niabella sp.]